MRMLALRRIHRDESGAVMMIVAISMIVLLGMLVLTVDVGRGIAVKREMVAGADAAALAAAQQCAMGNNEPDARAAAEDVLAQNKSAAVLTPSGFQAPECDGGPVN